MRSRPYREVHGIEWPALSFAAVVIAAFLGMCLFDQTDSTVARASDSLFRVTVVNNESLDHPWSVAFLPDGDALVTERRGTLRRLSKGVLVDEPLTGVPEVAARGQGGLLDVVLDPDFEKNRLVYLSYSAANEDGLGTEVARGVLTDSGLEEVEVIFVAEPKMRGGRHFGSRLLFDEAGYLFITLGDRGARENAQDLATHPGSIVRIHPDGSIPKDNPFVGQIGARPEIFSYGHRNPQGLALDKASGRIWSHEHGPQGGDELNLIRRGGNYGWPVVSHGEEYGGGSIGEGTEMAGMVSPSWVWVPSIAPSGLAFYDGDIIKDWRGSLVVGALKYQLVARLGLGGANVTDESRFLETEFGRIRDVRTGPDGFVYLLTDDDDGKLVRIEPL